MRILFVDQFGEPGGAQFCWLDALPAFNRRGDEMFALLPQGSMHALLRANGIETRAIDCGPYARSSKSVLDLARFCDDWPKQVQAISRAMNHFHPDLIYINGPLLLPAVAAAAGHSVPVLFHAHHHISQLPARWLTARALRHCEATTIACSHRIAETWRRHGLTVSVVPNGTAGLTYRERPKSETLRVGMVGQIAEEKGQHLLLRALSEYRLPIEVHLFGTPISTTWAANISRLSRGHCVHQHGWQATRDSLYNHFDVLVVASRSEGMPRVVLEAFSGAVLVTACPADGVSDLVIEGVTGILASDRSPRSLACALQRAAALSDEQRHAITRQARSTWQERYMLERYQRLVLQATLDAAFAPLTPTPGRQTQERTNWRDAMVS